ncbi:52 kDa repressor of the inhibitor of the protein kinase-like [Sipha flava]|uniref:52 kDa repressor of the inhibitor of the protein kinase-like n=1 Tax=Sipha flava TaxID=143950 RepID=A0A8B8FWM0_9HEMI|nr:52 kDa repressor of the inhibitor of the protein kinase-like [Sipha flava]
MSGQFNGVRSHISQLYPMATHVHCTAHTLNLAVSKSCTIQPIRNCLGTIGKTCDFFVYPKRKNILSQAIEDFNGTINAKTLKRNCAIRWIERFHSVHGFIELLECVIDSLDTIISWSDGDTSSQANNLKNSILQGEFIISLLVLSKIFAIGLPLSKQFQSVAIDLREAMVLANATLSELKTIRCNVDEYFHDIYTKASALAQELCFSITLPRIACKQKNRDNYSVNTPEEYFKITIFIPYLDLFINEIESRFIEHQKILKGFQNLFLKTTEMSTLEKDEFISLIDFYNHDLADNNKDILISELKLWQRKILPLDKQSTNAMDALIICNDMYPNIYKLLQILATLSVSTASSERSFSSLQRIKTYLRNTMSEKRLNGLAMLSIHRSISVDAKEVLDELSTNKRRVDFIL